jgi:nucleotide-binding universal stress UspA family protein
MSARPIVVAVEPGPCSYAALRAAADLARRLSAPLNVHALVAPGSGIVRVLRRFKLAVRRRGIEAVLLRPRGGSLLTVDDAAREASASLLVVARTLGRGRPGISRRLLLGRLFRRAGPPVLVVSRHGRPLGDRVLVAQTAGVAPAPEPFYGLLAPILRQISVLRYLPPGSNFYIDAGLDACIERAVTWDERVVSPEEADSLGDAVLDAAERIRPSLLAVAQPAEGPGLAALLAPETVDRVAFEPAWSALVARQGGWRDAAGGDPGLSRSAAA